MSSGIECKWKREIILYNVGWGGVIRFYSSASTDIVGLNSDISRIFRSFHCHLSLSLRSHWEAKSSSLTVVLIFSSCGNSLLVFWYHAFVELPVTHFKMLVHVKVTFHIIISFLSMYFVHLEFLLSLLSICF